MFVLSPLLSDDSCPGFPLWTDYCHLKRRLFTLKQYRDCIKDIINIDKIERAWKRVSKGYINKVISIDNSPL